MNSRIKLLILFSLIIFSFLGFQQYSSDSFILTDARMLCCENGSCDGLDCYSSNATISLTLYGCPPNKEQTVTCKECVDAIMSNKTCSGTTRYTYCIDNEVGGVRYSSWCGFEVPLSISIEGPTSLYSGYSGYFEAVVYGGCTLSFPNNLQWYIYYPCEINLKTNKVDSITEEIDQLPCGVWDTFGGNTSLISRSDTRNFWLKCKVTNSFSGTVTSQILFVDIIN